MSNEGLYGSDITRNTPRVVNAEFTETFFWCSPGR
jgi:hypothetical protein